MATCARFVKAEPRYTANKVSNVLPSVLISTAPPTGAVQVHHTDVSPAFEACNGSPASRVASMFEPFVVSKVPPSEMEFWKLSFGGLGIGSLTQTRLRLIAPDSTLLRSLKPSTA